MMPTGLDQRGSFHEKFAERITFMERMEFSTDSWSFGRLARVLVWLQAGLAKLMQAWLAHLEARNLARMRRSLDGMSDHMRRDVGLPTRVIRSRWHAFDRFGYTWFGHHQ
jgi:alkylhydroperoxidase family enzyme